MTLTYDDYHLFQSTLPVWGATARAEKTSRPESHFNPRSPCGERPGTFGQLMIESNISIHAPRVGSDKGYLRALAIFLNFNPRSPCGERLCSPYSPHKKNHFNPRSPCGERLVSVTSGKTLLYFNPRSPCGERRMAFCHCWPEIVFQSTLPVWGATLWGGNPTSPGVFQSTLPVWGATSYYFTVGGIHYNFNPRSPWGERPHRLVYNLDL